MASAYRKKDIREEMDMFRKEGDKTASGSALSDRVAERALAALAPVVSTT